MNLLRRIVRRLRHELRRALTPQAPATEAMQELAAERKLSAAHRWVASVAVANLKARAAELSRQVAATAEGQARAERRARDVEDYVRLGGMLPRR